ncbi:hypothetical protein SFC88_15600 [Nocardioides sp. HM23]|uniref:hypothetical protein n=1 Tax=Nocardioides bizhenqiangii TaxID=3095076 RepID=UPI002ACAABC4|nr:hypothetical protein [Nocardioides sp. HM23]MDZ5622266.1 hypothetical protein [Nocardioides sp. HM23]
MEPFKGIRSSAPEFKTVVLDVGLSQVDELRCDIANVTVLPARTNAAAAPLTRRSQRRTIARARMA